MKVTMAMLARMLRNFAPDLTETVYHYAVEDWEKHKVDYADPSPTGSDYRHYLDDRFSIFKATVASYHDRMSWPMLRVVVDFYSRLVEGIHVKMLVGIALLNSYRLDINWLLLHDRLFK